MNIQISPAAMKKFNGWTILLYIVLIPVSIWTGWIESVKFVSYLSEWALVQTAFSGYVASRAEVGNAPE